MPLQRRTIIACRHTPRRCAKRFHQEVSEIARTSAELRCDSGLHIGTGWLGTIFASLLTPAEYFRRVPTSVSQMGDVLQFIRKSDRDRIRLIREARAIYESIFPTETADIAPTGTVSIAPIGDDDTSP